MPPLIALKGSMTIVLPTTQLVGRIGAENARSSMPFNHTGSLLEV